MSINHHSQSVLLFSCRSIRNRDACLEPPIVGVSMVSVDSFPKLVEQSQLEISLKCLDRALPHGNEYLVGNRARQGTHLCIKFVIIESTNSKHLYQDIQYAHENRALQCKFVSICTRHPRLCPWPVYIRNHTSLLKSIADGWNPLSNLIAGLVIS